MIEQRLPEITVSNKNKTEFSITNYISKCVCCITHHDESMKSKCSTESLIMLGIFYVEYGKWFCCYCITIYSFINNERRSIYVLFFFFASAVSLSKRVWVIMENWVYKSKCKNLTVIITIITSIAVGFLRWFRWN